MEIIGSIIFIIVLVLLYNAPYRKMQNRVSPPGMKTDWAKMNYDTAMGMDKREVAQRFNRGVYDIPDKRSK